MEHQDRYNFDKNYRRCQWLDDNYEYAWGESIDYNKPMQITKEEYEACLGEVEELIFDGYWICGRKMINGEIIPDNMYKKRTGA